MVGTLEILRRFAPRDDVLGGRANDCSGHRANHLVPNAGSAGGKGCIPCHVGSGLAPNAGCAASKGCIPNHGGAPVAPNAGSAGGKGCIPNHGGARVVPNAGSAGSTPCIRSHDTARCRRAGALSRYFRLVNPGERRRGADSWQNSFPNRKNWRHGTTVAVTYTDSRS